MYVLRRWTLVSTSVLETLRVVELRGAWQDFERSLDGCLARLQEFLGGVSCPDASDE